MKSIEDERVIVNCSSSGPFHPLLKCFNNESLVGSCSEQRSLGGARCSMANIAAIFLLTLGWYQSTLSY